MMFITVECHEVVLCMFLRDDLSSLIICVFDLMSRTFSTNGKIVVCFWSTLNLLLHSVYSVNLSYLVHLSQIQNDFPQLTLEQQLMRSEISKTKKLRMTNTTCRTMYIHYAG